MQRPPTRTFQTPASQAGDLLIRMGFAILVVVAPLAAVGSRRTIFSLVPVGTVLILIGCALSMDASRLRLREILLHPIALLAIGLGIWAGLSLSWTPFVAQAAERFGKTAGTCLLAAAALALLPQHTKTSNIYLLPIGVAAASVAAIGVVLLGPPELVFATDPEGSTLQRASIGLIVLVWPALAALAVRERWASAGALSVAAAFAAIAVWIPIALAAMAIGALVFSLAVSRPKLVGLVLAIVSALMVLLAPLVVLALQIGMRAQITEIPSFPGAIAAWAEIIRNEGARNLTGHGFDTAMRGIAGGYLPLTTPRNVVFEVWYELGLLGAVALAALCYTGFVAAGRQSAQVAPFMLAGLVTALAMTASGIFAAQLWWVAQLCIVVVAFGAVMKGQYRTVRPAAALSAPPQPAM